MSFRRANEPTVFLLVLLAPLVLHAADEAERKAIPQGGHVEEIHPLTIRGRVINADGRPIAGATVCVADANSRYPSDYDGLLAQAVSDEDGRYELKDAPLRVLEFHPFPVPQPIEGKFQVFATAEGHGWSWRGVRSYRPKPRPKDDAADAGEPDPTSEPMVYYQGEALELNLVMQPEVRLHGRITNDLGEPLPGVKVQVGCTDDLRTGSPESWMSARYLALPSNEVEDESRTFTAVRWLPAAFRQTSTNDDGRYELTGLPRDATLTALISFAKTYEAKELMISTSEVERERVRSVGYDGELNETLVAPRKVTVRAFYEKGNAPVADVTVRVRAAKILRVGNVARSNDRGEGELSLPPGEYTLIAEPPLDAPYLVTEAPFSVPADGNLEHRTEITLRRGATVELRAVDADENSGVPGVSFLYESDTTLDRKELQSQTVIVDHPRTDESGLLRAVVPPGKMRFVVGDTPARYETISAPNELIELQAGGTHRLNFALRKSAVETENSEPPKLAKEYARILGLWERQRELLQQGRFTVRGNNYLQGDYTREEVVALLRSLEDKPSREILALLEAAFPVLRERGLGETLVTFEGEKRRAERFHAPHGTKELLGIDVRNGVESIRYSRGNAQVDIQAQSQSYVHILSVHDFVILPPTTAPRGDDPAPEVRQWRGGLSLQWRKGAANFEIVADSQTGFVRRQSSTSQEQWQFLPRKLDGGAMVPGVYFSAQFRHGRLEHGQVYFIEEAKLGPLPRDAFVVSAPAGTYVIDYRGGDGRPRAQSVVREPLTDVVKKANELSPNPSVELVLKAGEPAPKLAPLAWLDRDGEIDAPDVDGKVILVNFWATFCGPCVGAIPEIAAAERFFAERGVVVIGLHASGAEVEELAKFARAKDIHWPLAIDRPPSERAFGATFREYGVRGIASYAVIDREGRFVYCGDLRQALSHVRSLTD